MAASSCLCKTLLGILNGIVLLIGLALAVMGVLMEVAAGSSVFKFFEESIKDILGSLSILGDKNVIDDIDFEELFRTGSIILIVVGLVIACIAFLGYCGASCDYKILLILYTIVLGVLLVVQIIVVALFFEGKLDTQLVKMANKTLVNSYQGIDGSNPESVIWNVVMIQYECCGLDNYEDFDYAKEWDRNRTLEIEGAKETVMLLTPIACCAMKGDFPNVDVVDDMCAVTPNANTSNWEVGCWNAVKEELSPHRTYAILVITAIFIVEAVIMAVAILILKLDEKD